MKDSLFKKFLSGFVAVFMIFTCNMPMLAYAVDNDGLQVATSEQLTAADPNAPPATPDEGKEGAGALTAQAETTLSGGETVSKGGTYTLSSSATGTITIDENLSVKLVGIGATKLIGLNIVVGDGSTLTIQDLYADQGSSASTIDFQGSGTFLIEGENLIDNDGGLDAAVIHVAKGNELHLGGTGTLYGYKSALCSYVGGSKGEANGKIVFDGGFWFLKGTKTGAVIGGDSTSVKGDDIVINGGELYVKGVARGALIGGSNAGKSGDVYINGGLVELFEDFSGPAIGAGQAANAGNVYVTGGSIKTTLSSNSANSYGEAATFGGMPGVSWKAVKALNESDYALYSFDASKYISDLTTSTVDVYVDGGDKPFYSGRAYTYVTNEVKNPSDITRTTKDNWLANDESWLVTESDYSGAYPTKNGSSLVPEKNLYFALSKANHVLTVGDDEYRLQWDADAGAFVTLEQHAITSAEDAGGTVTVNPAKAFAGETVSFTATANEDYTLTGVSVVDAEGNELAVTESDGAYSFTMANSEVTVSGFFTSNSIMAVAAPLAASGDADFVVPADYGITQRANTETIPYVGTVSFVDVAFAGTGVIKHVATTGTMPEGYWVGIGIPKVEGASYAAGWGDADLNTSFNWATDTYDGEITVDGTEYRTFYFDAAGSLVNENRHGYLAVKGSGALPSAIYTLDFSKIVRANYATAAAAEHGSLTVNGAAKAAVNEGSTATVVPTAEEGYVVDAVSYKAVSATETTEINKADDGSYSFAMPAEAVTVSAAFGLKPYDLAADSAMQNGSVSFKVNDEQVTAARKGDTVTVVPEPAIGYEVTKVTYIKTDAEEGAVATEITADANGAYSFEMQGYEITVAAEFQKSTYTVTVSDSIDNATVKVTKVNDVAVTESATVTAQYGDTITLNATPADTYTLMRVSYTDGLSVKDATASADDEGAFTFSMPASNTTIGARAVCIVENISSLDDLVMFRDSVNAGLDYTGKTVTLAADINMESLSDWTPVGTASIAFTGTFDGTKKTISNLTIASGLGYTGLFANNAGTVKDFTVTGTLGTESVRLGGGDCFSPVVAYNTGTVSGVINKASMYVGTSANTYAVGGVVGRNVGGTVSQCGNEGVLNSDTSKDVRRAGGVVGHMNGGTITQCYNTAAIEAWNYRNGCEGTGGILGSLDTGGTVSFCYNTADVRNGKGDSATGGKQGAGGIVGSINAGDVVNCYATANAYGPGSAGVIVGKIGNGTYDHLFSLNTARSYQQYGTQTDSDTGLKFADGNDEGTDGALIKGGAALANSYNSNYTITNSYTKSADDLKAKQMVIDLNTNAEGEYQSVFGYSEANYPVFVWQGGTALSPVTANDISGIEESYLLETANVSPAVVVKVGETTLAADTDYTLAYVEHVAATDSEEAHDVAATAPFDAGSYTATITGLGSYVGTVTKDFTVGYDFTKATIGTVADQSCTGSAIEPDLTVSFAGASLAAGTDYEVAYANNVNKGTATATVTGIGTYIGTQTVEFNIVGVDIANLTIDNIADQPYTSLAIEPALTIKSQGVELTAGVDYTVVYENNIEVGQANATVIGSDNFEGVKDLTFNIVKGSASDFRVSDIASQIANGKALEPAVTVKNSAGIELAEGTDYAVAYLNNVEPGTGQVKIIGRGNYSGINSVDFTILDPSAPWNGSLDFSWYDEANPQTEYHIATPAQWASIAWICSEHLDELAAANEAGLGEGTFTNGNITAISGTIPTQQNYFTGVQFYLDNDIDMGGVKAADGTWTGPNYYPIGTESQNDLGQANGFISVFFGNFDGQGHYVNNINCQRGTSMDDQCVGLFGRVGQPDNDRGGVWGGKAYDLPSLTIQNIGVTGFIQGGRSVGGIVGKTLHVASGNSITIQNCVNRADVRGAQKKGTGGICGAFWNKPLMYNCYSVGTAQNGTPLGSVVGGNEGKMYNIYTTQALTITGEQAGGDVPYNSYIVTDTAMSGNYRGTVMATEEAKQAAFADTLGWAYVADTTGINGGYPVLFWEAGLTEADVKTAFDSAVVTVESDQSVTFTGSAVEPQISVTIDGVELTEGTDYTVNCVDNVNVGTATVTSVEGAGAYSGTVPVDVAFQIVPRDMSGATITAIATQWTDGAIAAEPAMTVRLTGPTATLVKDTDYEVAFEGNLEEGTATATLTGIGNYAGEATATFEVRLMDSSLEGTGTEADPYIISNQGELEYVAQMVNAGDAAWQAADYKIGADFTAENIDGLGKNNSALAFKGTIDGDGKTITLDKTVSASYTGFVAYATGTIDDPVVIKNLTLAGSVSNTASYTAAFVGNAGGYVEFADCTNKATVGPANSSYNAGFVANNNATLTFDRCVNAGQINGQQYNAGFVAQRGGGTFTNCANVANVTGSSDYAAGFIARQQMATTFNACFNTGTIAGMRYIGGFTGSLSTAAGSYNNVYNNGAVSGTSYVGGLIGYKQNQTFAISNAYNAQAVTGTSQAGGLVGYAAGNNTTSTFENAYWLAENPSVAHTVANANVIVTGEPQAKTVDEFKALASTLGEAFAEDGEGVNGGYPVLSWQGGLVSIDNAVVAPIADQVFTGSAIEPVVVATLDSKMLAAGVDYDVAYANNENVGTATVTITGKGGYTGTASGTFNITSPSIEACEVAEIASQPYTGKQITPAPVITYNGQELEYGVDYALVFKNNTNIGTATVNIVGGGNFSGYVERQFDIVESDLASGSIDAVADQAYTSEAIVPALKVRNSAGAELTLGQDYLVAAMNNTEIGTASVTVIGQGNYKGLNKTTFQIKPSVANPSSVTVAVSSAELTYNGAVQKPSVTAKAADGTELVQGTDYTVAYSNESSTAAGSYKVTVTGKGNYLGAVEMPYAIKATSLASATVAAAGQTYTGGALSPAPTVNLGGTALKAGTDYSVSYANNVNAGTATVTVTGKGNYAGAASSTFKIAPASLAGASVTAGNQTYTGGALTPAATVKLGSTALKSGADFTVSYAGNTNAGKATVSVTGKGNYTGTASGSFTIAKASQKVTTKNKTFSFKVAKVKKKAQVAKAAKVKKGNSAKTAITYKLVKANKSKAKFKVASNGKITVKKGTAKGTYKLTIKATAKATANYNAASKNFVVTVKVK